MTVDVKAFERILADVIKAESGIKKVILVDRTGLTIAYTTRFSYFKVDVEGIGAIASAVYCASEEQGKSLELGELQIVTSEFEQGKIFASSCGKGILCIITDESVNIGMVRLLMKKASEQLKAILDEFLAEKPAVQLAGGEEEEELKAAFGELDKV
ncbi:MAG: roadblock/LC7 domain-containing protein [Candidatus Jordarchaeales archaeon]|nr:roadblock/LC7 domain-containing protein [Candidatus Jordarchaeia archaeon]